MILRKSDLGIIATVFVSIGLAIWNPNIFGVFSPYVTALLMFFVFLSFLGIDLERGVKLFCNNISRFIFLFFYKLIILPIILYYISKLIVPRFSNGILLLSSVSTGVVAPFIGSLVGADMTTILVMVVVTTLSIPITMPVLVKWLSDIEVALSFLQMVKTLVFIIIVPVILAYLIRRYAERSANWFNSRKYILSLISLSLINLGVFSKYAHFFYQDPKMIIESILVSICLATVYFLAGYYPLVKAKSEIRLATTISLVNINNVLIIVFGGKFFGPLEPTLAAVYMFPFFLAILPLRWVSSR